LDREKSPDPPESAAAGASRAAAEVARVSGILRAAMADLAADAEPADFARHFERLARARRNADAD
jgi:hypothetical protein